MEDRIIVIVRSNGVLNKDFIKSVIEHTEKKHKMENKEPSLCVSLGELLKFKKELQLKKDKKDDGQQSSELGRDKKEEPSKD